MATILNFRQNPGAKPKPHSGGAPCQVVFFTGVRYERAGLADARRPDQRPKDRGVELQATVPG